MFRLLIFTGCVLLALKGAGQCANPISSFPYSQDFETTDGGWTPGGTASQWSWGTPAKPVINGAGSGAKCWITGTLTQSVYSNNQNSTLTSPCFDLSSLSFPIIRFKVFWETEKKYDGASIEYSTDGGANWVVLGHNSDNLVCPLYNWYNTVTVTALGTYGWSGNVQPTAACAGGNGNGSGQWRTAQHEINELAGQPNVRFRFHFAAGSVCNAYDGFAIDDIWIGEVPPPATGFDFSCGTNNTVNFQPAANRCEAVFSWDFGDPASGASNTSTQYTPTHVFSGPGSYTVSLTVQGNLTGPVTTTRQVNVIDVQATTLSNINCHGDHSGSLQAEVQPAGNYTYEWNTSPVQTSSSISGLGPGNYLVKVSGTGVCASTAQIMLTDPPALKVSLGNDTVICNDPQAVLDAGIFSAYLWQDGSSLRNYTVTQTGSYWVEVMNNAGCKARDTVLVTMGCHELYFPSAFSPDGNGRNDRFGALGNAGAVREFRLRVFNRWGQLVFETTNPFQRWDGRLRGSLQSSESFVWLAEYYIPGRKEKVRQQGAVTLLR